MFDIDALQGDELQVTRSREQLVISREVWV
jgi:hypothetical protein